MNAKEIFERLNDETKCLDSMNIKQALCWYLYQKNVPCSIIAKAIKCRRRQVYKRMYTCRDLLALNNIAMKEAFNEISSHKVKIKPIFVETDTCVFHSGYTIIIDNEIYKIPLQ